MSDQTVIESAQAPETAPGGQPPVVDPDAGTQGAVQGRKGAGDASHGPAGDGEAQAQARSDGARRAFWASLALLCALAGIAGGLLLAHALASRQASAARRESRQGSAQISANLRDALRHEADLSLAAGTLFSARAKVSPAALAAWASSADVWSRYPELQRIGLLRARAHAPSRCVTIVEVRRGASPYVPAGREYCGRGGRVLATRHRAAALARAPAGRAGTLEVQTPVHRLTVARRGARAGRNASFAGWLREVLRPSVLLAAALAGHPGYSVQLRSRSASTVIAAAGGAPRPGARSATATIAGGLTLRSFGPPAGVSLLGGSRIWALLAGIVIGVLAGVVVLLLGLRRRAEPVADADVPAAPQPPAQALYDPLSGLPGRELTLDRAAWLLARVGRQSGLLGGALLVDIDSLGDVEEKLGRDARDQLLAIVAQRLQDVVRAGDTVGRLGGDRFVVLVETAARNLRLDALAQRVIEALHAPLELDGFGPSFSMTASIGVAFGRHETPDELLGDALGALEQARAAGGDRYAIFNVNARGAVEGRGVLDAELGAALQERHLQMRYEPIWDLDPGKVLGVEAQPCWLHPRRGLIAADELASLAQQSGLAVPIDRWAIETACAAAAAWEVEGPRIGVSVKVSAGQLVRDGLIVDIRRALQQSGLEPSLLTIQVSESAVMSGLAAAGERLGAIKQLGVGVAIDDFGGGGYAYHSDLRKLSLDWLRVDRGALAAAEDAEYRDWLFEAILMVGRELSLRVVAKGIDSEEQLGAIRAMGCGAAQGSALGEPVLADAVIALSNSGLAATGAALAVGRPSPEQAGAGAAGGSDSAAVAPVASAGEQAGAGAAGGSDSAAVAPVASAGEQAGAGAAGGSDSAAVPSGAFSR